MLGKFFGLSGLKLLGGGLGLVALAFLLWAAKDRFRAVSDLSALQSVVSDCRDAARDPAKPLGKCDTGPVRDVILAQRQTLACDAALGAKDRPAHLFAIRAACSSAVKDEVAARAAAEVGQRSAEQEVDRLIADQSAIAGRAEARGRDQGKRKEAADAAIREALPAAAAGGRKHCDARCLRRLTVPA